MNKIFKKTFLLFLFPLLLAPAFSFAANVFLETESTEFSQGGDVMVKVLLDTTGSAINAIEGKLTFPSDLLEIVDIQDGNTAVNFWVEKPHSTSAGTVAFSGVATGGVTKQKAFLFGVIFHVKAKGSGIIEPSDIRILQNDGKGTEARAETKSLAFSVTEGSVKASNLNIKDNTPPDSFLPLVAEDSNIFDGKHFLVFATQDKGSGIDHYEVKEGLLGKWKVAESPYLLQGQSLKSNIYVKAVDKNKNERIVKLDAQNKKSLYLELVFVAIMLIVGTLIIRNKLWPKYKK